MYLQYIERIWMIMIVHVLWSRDRTYKTDQIDPDVKVLENGSKTANSQGHFLKQSFDKWLSSTSYQNIIQL